MLLSFKGTAKVGFKESFKRKSFNKNKIKTFKLDINQTLSLKHGIYFAECKIISKNFAIKELKNDFFFQSLFAVVYFGKATSTLNLENPFFDVHILNINSNLIGCEIEINLLKFIREDKKFGDLNLLEKQIRNDVFFCQQFLSN